MADQMIFKRCEIKYMLDITQAELLKNQMKYRWSLKTQEG